MKKCLKCGTMNEDSAKFCAHCSSPFEKQLNWNDVRNSNGVFDDLFDANDIDSVDPQSEEKKEQPTIKKKTDSKPSIPMESEEIPNLPKFEKPNAPMQTKTNHSYRMIGVLFISLVISFGIYQLFTQNFTSSSNIENEVNEESDEVYEEEENLSFSQPSGETGQLLGSWKYEIFPGKADATEYLTFRSDGTFEMYENPGAAYATHCQGKQSGTYSYDGTNLTLNYMNANWPYTVTWIDENSLNLTYVSQVNTCTRVSDEEYNSYVN